MARIGDWFDVGMDAYRDDEHRQELLPPRSDMEAQRAWLAGFGAAWASGTEDLESVDGALVRVCEGRAELLWQLRSHRLGWGSRRVQ